MSTARAKTDMLAVLDHHVLQNVGHVFAAIDGALEELVDLFELDQGDRVLLGIEEVHHTASADQVRLVFQAIDFDAVLHDGAVVLQGIEGFLESFGATGYDFRKLDHGRGDRVDAVGHEAVGGIFHAIQHVIQCRGEIVDVLRIDGCNEGLVEPCEQFVDDFIAAVFQHVDFGGNARHARVAAPDAFQQEARSFRDDVYLFQKKVVKLLFAWQQSHNLDLIGRETMVIGLLTVGQPAITVPSQSETTPRLPGFPIRHGRHPDPASGYPAGGWYPRSPWRKAWSP